MSLRPKFNTDQLYNSAFLDHFSYLYTIVYTYLSISTSDVKVKSLSRSFRTSTIVFMSSTSNLSYLFKSVKELRV